MHAVTLSCHYHISNSTSLSTGLCGSRTHALNNILLWLFTVNDNIILCFFTVMQLSTLRPRHTDSNGHARPGTHTHTPHAVQASSLLSGLDFPAAQPRQALKEFCSTSRVTQQSSSTVAWFARERHQVCQQAGDFQQQYCISRYQPHRPCSTHSKPPSNKKKDRCQHVGCDKWASFNMEGKSARLYCAAHKISGMVNLKNGFCEQPHCKKRPLYNLPRESKGRFCAEHQQPGMEDVVGRICEQGGCRLRAAFDMPGAAGGRFCAGHRLDGMVNVSKPLCEFDSCWKIPHFNLPSKARGRFCVAHKQDGMIDVLATLCEEHGCSKQPSFGFVGDSRRRCANHKLDGMVHKAKGSKGKR